MMYRVITLLPAKASMIDPTASASLQRCAVLRRPPVIASGIGESVKGPPPRRGSLPGAAPRVRLRRTAMAPNPRMMFNRRQLPCCNSIILICAQVPPIVVELGCVGPEGRQDTGVPSSPYASVLGLIEKVEET